MNLEVCCFVFMYNLLGARGIEVQWPEMAGLDDGGGLLGLVVRRKRKEGRRREGARGGGDKVVREG